MHKLCNQSQSAKSADKNAVRVREELCNNIQQQFQQAARNATGSQGPNDLDDDASRLFM